MAATLNATSADEVARGPIQAQTDEKIERNRTGRIIAFFLFPPTFLLLGYFFGKFLIGWLGFTSQFLTILGESIGLGLGFAVAGWVVLRSTIENGATQGSVSVNQIASLLGINPLVSYGPGKHFCYFFEHRQKENTVSLAEMAVPFSAEVQTKEGNVFIKGSTRLRADVTRLPEFISGAGAVASDVQGLIIAFIVGVVSKKDAAGKEEMGLFEVLQSIKPLNDALEEEFQEGLSDFEERFGVIIGDTTVEQILPSDEVKKTMSGVAEFHLIDKIVANSFAKESAAEVEAAIKAGELAREEVNRRRTQVMAASGNLQGMDLRDHNMNINLVGLKDLDPEVAKAFAANAPFLAAFLQQQQQKGGKK